MAATTRISVEFPGGTDNAAYVTFVTPDVVRYDSDPLSCFVAETEAELKLLPSLGDHVQVEKVGRRAYRFVRVVKEASLRRFQFILTPEFIESPELQEVLVKVVDLGGQWEQMMGGVLAMFIPGSENYDPTKEVESLWQGCSQQTP